MKPRERLKAKGVEALTDRDLLAVIIGSGSRFADYKLLASRVLKLLRAGDLKEAGLQQLQAVEGMGEVKALQILSAIELGRRLFAEPGPVQHVRDSKAAYNLVRVIGGKRREVVKGLFLNARFEVLALRTLSVGTFNKTVLAPRDVVEAALELNCAYVILAHNHPSGSDTPSNEDVEMTSRVSQALELISVKLLDHLIITQTGWTCIPFKG